MFVDDLPAYHPSAVGPDFTLYTVMQALERMIAPASARFIVTSRTPPQPDGADAPVRSGPLSNYAWRVCEAGALSDGALNALGLEYAARLSSFLMTRARSGDALVRRIVRLARTQRCKVVTPGVVVALILEAIRHACGPTETYHQVCEELSADAGLDAFSFLVEFGFLTEDEPRFPYR